MAPIIASSLIGAGSSVLSKGLNALFDRVGRKDDDTGGQGKFGITGQNLPGTGSKDPGSMVQDLFKAIDTDGDKAISGDELKSYVEQQKQALQAQLVQIQADHSSRVHSNQGKGGENRADRLFSKIDTDGNGKLTSDELSAYLKSMADRLRGTAETGPAQVSVTSGDTTTASA